MTMINVNKLYGDDAKYVDDASAAALSQIDEVALPALNAALDELNGEGQLGCDCRVAVTHETLADFDSARSRHWAERGTRGEFEFAGLKAVKFCNFQLFKWTPRNKHGLIVVDLGDVRVCLT